MPWSTADLDLLRGAEEVRIETRAGDGTAHRTIIWIVVVDGEAFVRSYRGATARWYREALRDPEVALLVAGRRIAVRAVPAPEPSALEGTSAALRRKYAGDPAMPAMLRDEILATTLRLAPAGEPGGGGIADPVSRPVTEPA